MAGYSDDALSALLAKDPERGWRAFIDQFTPTLVALIERAGVSNRDAVAEVYVRVCERLVEDDCARLRRYDPRKGALAAWLTIIVRHVVVDWVRSEKGRPRLFGAIQQLDGFDRRVFELYYWEHRRPAEIAGLMENAAGRPVDLAAVFEALHRIHRVLSERHRSQLLALVARTRPAASLETDDVPESVMASSAMNPERAAHAREVDDRFAQALGQLPAEDAAILRLTFVQGWSRAEIQRALHLPELPAARIRGILDRLRGLLASLGLGSAEAATPGLAFLEDDRS